MNMTNHASKRAQQRCIPPLIDQWLDQYGEEKYDKHGGIRCYFSHTSISTMERDFGKRPVQKLSGYFNVYKVVSSHDGQTITIGHRTRRMNMS